MFSRVDEYVRDHVGLAKVLARLWVDPDIRGADKAMGKTR
jgi:hypothetical protein